MNANDAEIRSKVREKYGELAESTASCCGSTDTVTLPIEQLYDTPEASNLPEGVTELSLGCGDPVTLAQLEPGQTVLDLGSGGGIDCFLAAKQVGDIGHVIGVDMTPQMLEKARANKIKVGAENVEFRLGEIEHLPVADRSIDVVISNCVINLSTDKPQVFREAFRVLKPGGKLSVSDIMLSQPLPTTLRKSLEAWVGCVSGALEVDEYVNGLKEAGFMDIEISRVDLDKDLCEASIEKSGAALQGKEGCCQISVQASEDTEIFKLSGADLENARSPIFSGKITARKPA